ncbi:MAG: hypothetical protein ABEJ87_06000 [Candidatus Nanohalobium sp.]
MSVSFPGLTEEDEQLVEDAIGITPSEVIDRVEPGAIDEEVEVDEVTNTKDTSKNKVDLINGEKVLITAGELQPENLAHETVHAEMIDYENKGIDLYGDNLFDQRLYAEFAAHAAQDILGEVNVDGGEKMTYTLTRLNFLEKQEEAVEHGLPDEGGLYEQLISADEIEDDQVKEDFKAALHKYRDSREQTLAAYAASQYREENDVDIQEIINPDRETYNEIVNYIKESEEELI